MNNQSEIMDNGRLNASNTIVNDTVKDNHSDDYHGKVDAKFESELKFYTHQYDR